MFPGFGSGRRRLPQNPAQRKLLLFWCWLYLSMGAATAVVGALFLLNTRLFTGGRTIPMDGGLATIAGILIVFGLLRIANSVYHIRRLSRMR